MSPIILAPISITPASNVRQHTVSQNIDVGHTFNTTKRFGYHRVCEHKSMRTVAILHNISTTVD